MSTSRFQHIENSHQLDLEIAEKPAVAIWFSGPDCGVCGNLKPKLEALFSEKFPAIELAEVKCAELPETAAGHMVFSVPTLIIFLDGRESLRQSRNISLTELGTRLQRSYGLLFGPANRP